MTNAQTQPLDPGFARLSGMVAQMGEGFLPQRHSLSELIGDTRDALDRGQQTHRQRMGM